MLFMCPDEPAFAPNTVDAIALTEVATTAIPATERTDGGGGLGADLLRNGAS